VDGEWTRDGLGMDWRWTGQGVEGLKVDSTRTPWTRGGLHRDSTRISGGVINTGSMPCRFSFQTTCTTFYSILSSIG